jgi:hypothetical protein
MNMVTLIAKAKHPQHGQGSLAVDTYETQGLDATLYYAKHRRLGAGPSCRTRVNAIRTLLAEHGYTDIIVSQHMDDTPLEPEMPELARMLGETFGVPVEEIFPGGYAMQLPTPPRTPEKHVLRQHAVNIVAMLNELGNVGVIESEEAHPKHRPILHHTNAILRELQGAGIEDPLWRQTTALAMAIDFCLAADTPRAAQKCAEALRDLF